MRSLAPSPAANERNKGRTTVAPPTFLRLQRKRWRPCGVSTSKKFFRLLETDGEGQRLAFRTCGGLICTCLQKGFHRRVSSFKSRNAAILCVAVLLFRSVIGQDISRSSNRLSTRAREAV